MDTHKQFLMTGGAVLACVLVFLVTVLLTEDPREKFVRQGCDGRCAHVELRHITSSCSRFVASGIDYRNNEPFNISGTVCCHNGDCNMSK